MMEHCRLAGIETARCAFPILVALMVLGASSAPSGQIRDRESLVPDVVMKVILDPTTYAPALVAWKATSLDWQSSQIFFQHGFNEHNPRFTVSGRGDDVPVSYAAGNRQIFNEALSNLQLSVAHNVADRLLERVLLRRGSNHPTLIRTIGWIERIGVASYASYRQSAGHVRQWRENRRLARQFGFN